MITDLPMSPRRGAQPFKPEGPYRLDLILKTGQVSADRPEVAHDAWYRIADKNDSAICTCYQLSNATRVVDALNYLWRSEQPIQSKVKCEQFNTESE